MNKSFSIIILFLLLCCFLTAQSFQLKKDFEGVRAATVVKVLPNDNVSCLSFGSNSGLVQSYIDIFTPLGSSVKHYSIGKPNGVVTFSYNYATNGVMHYFDNDAGELGINSSEVVGFDTETGEIWGKNLEAGTNSGGFITIGMTGNDVIINRLDTLRLIDGYQSAFELSRVDRTGTELWAYAYGIELEDDYPVLYEIGTKENGNILVVNTDLQDDLEFRTIVTELLPNGDILNCFSYSGFEAQEIKEAANGDLYLAGRTLEYDENFENNIKSDGVIARLDQNLNPIWVKKIIIDKLKFSEININPAPDGTVVFAYQGDGPLPTIVGRLSAEGELLSERGYPFRASSIEVAADNSVIFLCRTDYAEDYTEFPRFVLAKTNPDGTFDDCPLYVSCVEIEDFTTERTALNTSREVVHPLTDASYTVVETDLDFDPHCNTPPAPEPYFYYPDTLCVGDCLAPDSLRNQYAHGREWRVFAPDGTDTLLTTEATFDYCFDLFGTYVIEQKIWFLGCEYYYERSMETVRPVNVSLGDDRVFCEARDLIIDTNRPLETYLWQDGSTEPALFISETGEYHVLTADEHCPDDPTADTVFITLIDDLVDFPVLTAGEDTTVCRPFAAEVQSNYTDIFYLDDNETPLTQVRISDGGTHTITAVVEGCPFSDEITVDYISCTPPIYLPNVFSPNDDGINDYVQPVGFHFRTERVEVFDRWGGLLHREAGENARWMGENADAGVYLFKLTYFNFLTEEREVLVRDVLLTE